MMSNGELSKPMIIAQMTYTTPRDAVYRALTRWQRILRALTPKRQRESLLIHPADPGGLSLQFHEVADE